MTPARRTALRVVSIAVILLAVAAALRLDATRRALERRLVEREAAGAGELEVALLRAALEAGGASADETDPDRMRAQRAASGPGAQLRGPAEEHRLVNALVVHGDDDAFAALSRHPPSEDGVRRLSADVPRASDTERVFRVLGGAGTDLALAELWRWSSDPGASNPVRAGAIRALVAADAAKGTYRERVLGLLERSELPIALRRPILLALPPYGKAANATLLRVAASPHEQPAVRLEALHALHVADGAVGAEERLQLRALVFDEAAPVGVRGAAFKAQLGPGGMAFGDAEYLELVRTTTSEHFLSRLIARIDDPEHRQLPGVEDAIEEYRATHPEPPRDEGP